MQVHASRTQPHRVVIGEELVDLEALAPWLPTSMIELLQAGPQALATARQAAEQNGERLALRDV